MSEAKLPEIPGGFYDLLGEVIESVKKAFEI
jgi:hypothetical protein